MPTATPTIDIVGVPAGLWAINLTITVNGKVPPEAATRVWAELSEAGTIVKHTTAADANGKITWDGNIAGGWHNFFPRVLTVHTHFRGADGVEYKKDKILNLGYDAWGDPEPRAQAAMQRAMAINIPANISALIPVVGSLILGFGTVFLAMRK